MSGSSSIFEVKIKVNKTKFLIEAKTFLTDYFPL